MLWDGKSLWMDAMNKTFQTLALTACLLVAAVAWGSSAMAQATTTTTPTAPANTATTKDLSMGSDLAGGLPSQADATVGATYLATSFEKWQQRCVKTADGADPCQLFQMLFDNTGNSVAEISMFDLPPGGQAAAGATVMAPLETLLTANLKIQIDTNKAKVYPFAYCTKNGCVARIGFTADEVAALKKGGTATVTIVPAVAPDKPVDLVLPLKGFKAGFAAVVTANAAVKH